MKKYLLLLLLSLPGSGGYAGGPGAEQDHIQSLIEESSSYGRDSLLITEFRAFWARGGEEYQEFRDRCLRQIAQDAPVSKWPPARAHYFYMQGSEYLRKNQLYSAFDYLERAMIEFKKLGDEHNFSIVNNKFIPLMTWNMYENDIPAESKAKYSSYFSEALRSAEAAGNPGVIANIKITWAAYTLFILKDYRESLRMADEIMEQIKYQDPEKWFDYFHITMLGQSLNYLHLGETRKGEQILEQVVNDCLQRPDFNQAQYILGQVAGFVGRYYLGRKEYKKALKYATLAENRVNFMEFPYYSNYLNKTLYEAYKYNGHPDQALKYLEKIRAYEQEAKAEKLSQGFAEWQLKYETEKHQNQIASLENENLLKSEQQNRIILNALVVMVITGVIATVFIVKSNRKLKHKNEELKHKNEEISRAVAQGQTIERKRVASELHDNLNTKIAALKWRMESTENPTPEQLGTFVQILDDIYADVRLIAHNLIPTDLAAVGLVPSLQKVIDNLDSHPISFQFSCEAFSGRLPVDLEYQIYNIVLELINNVLKHSKATQARVSLSRTADKVTLTVSDNGIGLPADTVEGVGLTNIKSRVELLKGRISLQNTSGTTVRIMLPLS